MSLAQSISNPEIEDALFLFEEIRNKPGSDHFQAIIAAHPNYASILPSLIAELKEMDWLNDNDSSPEEEISHASGKQIFNGLCPIPDYSLVKKIGQGSFGEVWEALGPGNVQLAMKIIPLQDGINVPEIRSLEVLKNVRHPHLITIFGYWIRDNRLWIAMELANSNLLEFTQTNTNQVHLKELLSEAAEAIDYLNSPIHKDEDGKLSSILHRDIKPQNLLIVGKSLKVGDFGLARILDAQKNEHSGCMTPLYAPPEFFRGQMHRNSDQYSLAVTCSKLMHGNTPFEGTADEIVYGHLQKKPNLQLFAKSQQQIMQKALSKNPEQRYSSCSLFLSELFSANAEYGISAKKIQNAFLTAFIFLLIAAISWVTLWKKAEPQKKYLESILEGHTRIVNGVAISRDGKTGVSCGDDGKVIAWDMENKKQIFADTKHSQSVLSIDISRDGQLAISGGAYRDDKILLWDIKQGVPIKELKGHQHGIRSVKFLPNSLKAVSAGFDCTARLWDLEKGEELLKFENLDNYDPLNLTHGSPRQIWQMDITEDGKKAFSFLRGGKILCHEIDTGKLLHTFSGSEHIFKSMSLDPSGNRAITGYSSPSNDLRGTYNLELVYWDFLANNKKTLATSKSFVECCNLDPDQNMALFFPSTTKPFSLNLTTGEQNDVFENLTGKVKCLQLNQDRSRIIFGCKDGTVRLFEKIN